MSVELVRAQTGAWGGRATSQPVSHDFAQAPPRQSIPAPPPALIIMMAVLAAGDGIFLLRALASPWLGLAATLLLIGAAAWLGLRGGRMASPSGRAACAWVLAATVVLVLGGEGGLVSATEDWGVRLAVIGDLMRHAWPVLYDQGGHLTILRAPVGMYLAPALAGQALGAGATQVVLLGQNATLLAAILALFARGAASFRGKAMITAVILAFSGWDVVGQGLAMFSGVPFPLHIERWAGELEYPSLVTGLFWAPNHTLPALAYAAVHMAWRRGEVGAPILALTAGLSLLWSPLAVIGMAPFLILAVCEEFSSRRFWFKPWAAVALAGVSLIPVAIYLRLDGGGVPHGWNLDWPPFPTVYPIFMVLEVAPLLWLASLRDGRLSREALVAAALLALLPLYRLGLSNDLMMRASTPAVALLAVAAAASLRALWVRGERARLGVALAVLAIGAATPALQVIRALGRPIAPPSDASAPQAWNEAVYGVRDREGRLVPMTSYLAGASKLSPWRALLRQPDFTHAVAVPPPSHPDRP